jgi:hypothetical protein
VIHGGEMWIAFLIILGILEWSTGWAWLNCVNQRFLLTLNMFPFAKITEKLIHTLDKE